MRILLLKNLTDTTGRKYKKEDLLEQILKLENPLLGELGSESSIGIDLSKVSHSIDNIKFDLNDNLYGDIKILPTPMGKILDGLLEQNQESVRFGIRATGKVDENWQVSELILITFDAYFNNNN